MKIKIKKSRGALFFAVLEQPAYKCANYNDGADYHKNRPDHYRFTAFLGIKQFPSLMAGQPF